MSSQVTAKNPIKSTITTFKILDQLKELEGAGITELSEQLDIPKSSIHNYLSSLHQEGYVTKKGHEYHVGLRFLDLGAFARDQCEVYSVAKKEVNQLAKNTGELSNLMVEEHGVGIYLHRGTGEQAVQVDAQTGHRVYLHNTALGKAILAHSPAEKVEEILASYGLPKSTPDTISDKDALLEELEIVREQGVAFDREERLLGLQCAAVPILDQEQNIIAAISVSGPKSRMNGSHLEEEITSELLNAKNVIELNLTHR